MSSTCPSTDDLIALLDGEATENRAAEIRAHLPRCASCREAQASLAALRAALAAPLSGVPDDDAVARILQRIEAESSDPAPAAPAAPARHRRALARGAALSGALAVAAAAVLLLRRPVDPGEFTARGGRPESSGAPHALHREVGVTVRRGGGERLPPLADGDSVTGETTYAVSYRNLGPSGSAFLMVFAVDSARVVHWIHPAYLEAASDPTSVPLDHAADDELLPAAMALEGPAPGDLSVVTLVTVRPLEVSQIEALGAGDLEPARLAARFAGADVSRIALHLH